MNKDEIMYRLGMVMKTLDTGIEVTGVKNAGNLVGCFSILEEVSKALAVCEITPIKKNEDGIELE